MQHGPKPTNSTRHRPAKRWTSNAARHQPTGFQSARINYERYLTLALAEVQNGNTIAAENYYQHAEHYFRLMSATSEGG